MINTYLENGEFYISMHILESMLHVFCLASEKGDNKLTFHECKYLLRIFRIKEPKVCIQLSLSIHQEYRDEIRENPPTNWRKKTFLNGITNVHN